MHESAAPSLSARGSGRLSTGPGEPEWMRRHSLPSTEASSASANGGALELLSLSGWVQGRPQCQVHYKDI